MSDGMLNQALARSDRVRWLKGPAEQLPFDDEALDAVVTTSAFTSSTTGGIGRIPSGATARGLVAVATMSALHPLLQGLSDNRWKPQHNPSPAAMRALFEGAGFTVTDQHRVRRPIWTQIVSDVITFGTKS